MIYLELSDRAGEKTLELDGCFSIVELIDIISERLTESDEEDSDEETESETDSEEAVRQMKADDLWLDLAKDLD